MTSYIFLAIAWILWCILHSFTISQSFRQYLRTRLGTRFRFFRLSYNLFAGITILPVVYYMYKLDGPQIIVWYGGWKVVPLLLNMLGLLLFWLGARYFHMGQFMGLDQIRSGSTHVVLTGKDEITTDGVLGFIRHPWYMGGLLLLWGSNMDLSRFITTIILSVYLVIGTLLEERKLIAEYGEQYKSYRQQVSMYFPLKWIKRKLFNS